MQGSKSTEVWIEAVNGARTPVLGSCVFGRSPSCQVVLADAKISRQHALIQGQGEFWLIDLGSANGTYLNGRRVSQPCRLTEGDRIGIASHNFVFHGPGGLATPTPAPSAGDATIHEIRSFPCWLLLADIEGSTQLLRKLPAEEAPRVTGLWLAACRKILEQHQGTINKFLGDGFLAYWPGGPETASLVAQTLLALKKLQESASPLFRVVVHYGRVSAGGAASLGEESLMGNEVNFLFRAEKLAPTLGEPRLLSEPAKNHLHALLPVTPAGTHRLPGFEPEFAFFSF